MGIETKGGADGHTDAPRPTETFSTSGSTSAMTGSLDFLKMSNSLGISRIDSTIEPYIDTLMKLLKNNLSNVELVRMTKSNNLYAFKHDGADGHINFFGIKFISTSDPITQNMLPASMHLRSLNEELKERYNGKAYRLVDARVIVAGHAPDMDRAEYMADTIVRMFQVSSDPTIRNAQISSLVGNEFIAEWDLFEARQMERQLSPHGIAPRMELALTLKAKLKNDSVSRDFREFGDEYRPLGVVGGYVEIREKERVRVGETTQMRYQPIFHITVLNSFIPLEGVGAILLAAIAPTILNTQFYARQWQDLAKDAPQPGYLEEDPDNRGQPIILKSREELLDFTQNLFATPVISFQFQDGRDSIPGMWRMGSEDASVRSQFIDRLTGFFNTEKENASQFDLSRIIEYRFDGAYGSVTGIMNDSRDIDFLRIAAQNGWSSIDRETRRIMLGTSDSPTERAKIVKLVTGSFYPLYLTTVAIINPDFFKWVVQKTDRARLQIVDPNGQAESRSVGSFLDGFGSAAGLGSIIGTGAQRAGLNISSFRRF